MLAADLAGAREWGGRAIALAEALGKEEIVAHALNNIGSAELEAGGRETLERSLALARAAGLEEHVARAYCNLTANLVKRRDHRAAAGAFVAGLAYCTERDLDSWVLYILAWRAMAERDAGAYDRAVATASEVLRHPRAAPIARIPALSAIGLTHARRGDARRAELLAEALRLARPTGELQRIGQVAAAMAEAA